MEKGWRGLPYHSVSEHFKRIFSQKVYKIPVSVVDDCPNRMGLKGMQTCSFCDVWGSAAREESFTLDLNSQILKYRETIAKRYKAENFLVYFQAYTNTFTKASQLRENFDTALAHSFVRGLVIGTRPDCLSEAVLQLWQEYCLKTHVGVELGVQSFYDEHLKYMRRGHSAEDSLKAIKRIAERTSVDLGIHLIFGSPSETMSEVRETARICNDLPITNVKLHNLHVLKNTPLAEWYAQGEFTPLSFEQYRDRVAEFLSHLHPRIAVHRLLAYAPRWEELIAPDWTADKMGPHQKIVDHLRAQKIYQGCNISDQTPEDRQLFHQMSLRVERTNGI